VIYPDRIRERLERLRHNTCIAANASATAANFTCGTFVRFSLSIDIDAGTIADASYSSNGCGFMLAAADLFAEFVIERKLRDLHGLAGTDMIEHVRTSLGEFPSVRRDCVAACIDALHAAFADHRRRRIEEFQGEKALVCTCFGVSEEAIEALVAEESVKTVEDITLRCNAGGGCGSCRMLIEEILECSKTRTNTVI
jgi:NifU-like protein